MKIYCHFTGKKLGEKRNDFLSMFGETLPNKLLLLSKKSLHIMFSNKKIKWLKFFSTTLLKAKK